MASNTKNTSPGTYDYVIVGAGPAGVQMGYFLSKAGRNYVILEANETAGEFFQTQPRHRTLISINKRFNPFPEPEFNMRHDWNSLLNDDPEMKFTKYSKELFPSADDLVRYVHDFVNKFQINIAYNTRVKQITKVTGDENANFSLTTANDEEYKAKVLMMATGALSEKIPPNIEGKEHIETYSSHDITQEKYEGKAVCIIGNGNSAFETANHLAGHASITHIFGDRKLKHAWNTHFVGDLRAINNTVLDMYQLKSLAVYQSWQLTKVEKLPDGKLQTTFHDVVPHWRDAQGHISVQTPPYDHVICCTGFQYIDTSLFADDIKPETKTDGKFPCLNSSWESSVPNLYYIGTNMQCRDRMAASGFIHGFRYNVRTLSHLLQEKYDGVPYPRDSVSLTLDSLADKIVSRASICDSIYQMNNFLCHVMAIPDFQPGQEDTVKAHYFEDLPKAYVMEGLEGDRYKDYKHVFIMVLQYGFHDFGEDGKEAMDFVHTPDLESGDCQAFLHPTVSYYKDGKYQDIFRIAESLLLRFDVPPVVGANPKMNHNRTKNYFNKHLNLEPGKEFNDHFFGSIEELKKRVTPFTEEEKESMMDMSKFKDCIPYSIDVPLAYRIK